MNWARMSARPRMVANALIVRNPANVIDDLLGDLHVVVCPVMEDPRVPDQPFFVVSTAGPDKAWRADMFMGDEATRSAVILAMAACRPRVIHDMADELDAARLCEALWPGEAVTRLREGVELERAAASSTQH